MTSHHNAINEAKKHAINEAKKREADARAALEVAQKQENDASAALDEANKQKADATACCSGGRFYHVFCFQRHRARVQVPYSHCGGGPTWVVSHPARFLHIIYST